MRILAASFRRGLALVLRYPIPTLLLAGLITALAAWGTSRLKIQANFVDLLPEQDPAVTELRRLETVVGGASFVVLTAETDRPELIPPFFDALAGRLDGHPAIRYVDYRPPVDFFRRNALLYLPTEDLQTFVERVERRIDQAKLEHLAVDLADPETQLTLEDFEQKYPALLNHRNLYQSADDRLFVMLIKPNGRATDTQFTRRLLDDIDSMVASVRADLAASAPGAPASPTASDPGPVRIQLTGPYVKAMTQNAIALRDAKRVSLLSTIGMLAFLLIYFRRKRAVFLIGIPLLLSMLWAMGIAYWVYGTLNFFSSMAAAVLLGLSTDFGVHLYSRYLDHRREGESPPIALQSTFEHLGLALWAAAVTTVAGFLALALSHFKAFYQFGVIIAVGMICCLMAMATVFPALTLLLARVTPERDAPNAGLPLLQRLAHRVGTWAAGSRPFLIGTVCAAIASVPIGLGRVHFDYNFSNILGIQATRGLDDRVDAIFTHSINPEVARTESTNDAAAFATAIRQAKTRNATRPWGTGIKTALALSDFVPTDQPAKRALIARLRAAFTKTVITSLMPDERAVYDRLAPALEPSRVTAADVPPTIRTKFRDLHGEYGKFLFILPNFHPQNGREFMRFVEELRAVECPDCQAPVTISGESVMFYEIIRRMFGDGPWVMGASCLGVFVALLIAFRRWTHAIRCFVPFGVGLVAMFGILGAFQIPLTLISIAVIPILIGIGIDYPIYIYQQYLRHGAGRLSQAYGRVAPPIFASTVTTIIGFGCLLMAQNRGARSFGLAAVIGLTTTMLAALLWFPGWLAWLERRRTAARPQAAAEPLPAEGTFPTQLTY